MDVDILVFNNVFAFIFEDDDCLDGVVVFDDEDEEFGVVDFKLIFSLGGFNFLFLIDFILIV